MSNKLVKNKLPGDIEPKELSDFEAEATTELIAMAIEPVHPGITERLRSAI